MFTLAAFMDDCRAALKDAAPELAVKDLLERTTAHPAEVETVLGTPRQGEIVTLHRSPDLTVAGRRTVETQDILILGQAAIHAVANPLRRLTGAIHV